MKKIIYLFIITIFFLGLKANAQQTDEYKHTADSLFLHLDKTGVSTGVLYDRVFPSASLNDFNLAIPDTSSMWHFIQGYSEFYRSAYNPSSSWLTVSQLKENIALAKTQGQIPIGLGNYQFNVIDTNAIDLGLIRLEQSDSLYYDVLGRQRHPFNTINSFVAAALVDSVRAGYVSFYLSSAFTFNYSNKTLTNLSVDFKDGGGLQSVSLSCSKSVYYATSGYVNLKFVATFSDNTTVTTYSIIKIFGEADNNSFKSLINSCDMQTTFTLWSKLSFQGYDESIATKGKGDVTVYHSKINNCDGIIRKPLIIIDGFDPGDEQKAYQLYDLYLNNPDKALLGDSLRNRGYDLFILNFPNYQINGKSRDGGADYIERNARVLMALIDTVNLMKQGNEKLVIIGPSMGGLISRYALAYMEQHNMPHQTRLWVSFDTPHNGANIPIGDQRWLDFYGRKTESEEIISKRDGKIGSIAAKQMLVSHYLSPSSVGAPGFRNQFLSNINTLGFPVGDSGQAFRKIALIDGSLGGTEINSPGQKGFTFDVRRYRKRLFIFKVKYRTFTVAAARMYFTPSYGGQNTVFDGWFLNKAEEYTYSTLSNTSGIDVSPGGIYNTQWQIADGGDGVITKKYGLSFKARFYSVVPNHSFINSKSALAFTGSNQNLSENISNRSLVCTGETPFDSYFGDVNKNRDHVELWPEAVDYILKEIDGIPQLPLIKNTNLSISGPVQSGGNTTYSIPNLPSGATVKWAVTSPYTINGFNTANPVGIVIPTNNNQFSMLAATVSTNCYKTIVTKQLVPPIITISSGGNGGVCGEATAQINLPNGANFHWTSDGDVIINGQGQSVYTTDNNVSIVGLNGLVYCTFMSYNNEVVTYAIHNPYQVTVSIAANPMYGSEPLNGCIQNLNFGYTAIRWYIDGSLSNNTGECIYESNLSCGNHTIRVEADLACGITLDIAAFEVERYCSWWWRSMVIYPNPTIGSNLFVAPDENKMAKISAAEKSKMKEYEVWLYDDKSKLRLKVKSKNLKVELDTRSLPSATYFLHMRMDGDKEIIKKQVLIRN
ncbi:hypothetical protein GM921_13015 [Pedobacter sp. LMG 31464]|uniref:GPI inositol-deacylase PGAP1-like alpha/beta domain-containing protein n=1 Tax=Pedobacter planticolens TaxID=2679964 RepID=A0A923IUW4_9SPHI|nr:hypothetical protein [Pedobacter planticolens]MBB2146415.1 hypothetical protein [Pedobacter planticolens]